MVIAENRKARHDYFIEEHFEAGLVLQGWEAKAIRAGHIQLNDTHVLIREGELFVFNMHISPLRTTSTHVKAYPDRSRKLLMHRSQINKLIGKVEMKGYALVPLNLHFSKGRIKLELALAKGKKSFDKRNTIKDRDWAREKERLMKHDIRNT
ncbi:SsrA-binding protein SmpB [Basilea psittacipulmonis]|uniref:SsrA-binding protein n=1 Tax=Basilea psittacipulmonis DSM 24701 TaxID=1072685 RepID=A0A077DHR2_9BURK|nr:SsrA-binding protein SmpB [Basilea psittacipulmonis]AIL32678.1 SsrA-binding protein [Basilea psittacipulmonis DSM 24701]